jgi:predicted Rossmann fold nucleotide-binding protein DprA/Smf involved in DNA uptake
MAADLTRIAGRFAAILDALTDQPISGRALAREVGMPRSTTFDYLEALEANGRAERTPRGWTEPSADFLFRECPAHPDGSGNRGVT